jgi:hypothetical protein
MSKDALQYRGFFLENTTTATATTTTTTTRSRGLPEKLTGPQPVKKFPAFY